jgi:hypothetical protein
MPGIYIYNAEQDEASVSNMPNNFRINNAEEEVC